MSATPALTLLHGFLGRPENWDDLSRTFVERGVICTRLPLPGHDAAAPLVAGSSFDGALRAWIAGVAADRKDAPRAGGHLVGYSMGARWALAWALAAPLRWRGLILIGVHPGLGAGSALAARRAEESRWVEEIRRAGLRAFVDRFARRPIFASQNELPAPVRERQAAVRMSHDAEQVARAIESLGLAAMPDFRPRLSELRLPVTLIVGEWDARCLDIASEMLAALPQAKLVVAPEAGHNVVLEQPQWLARTLARELEFSGSERTAP